MKKLFTILCLILTFLLVQNDSFAQQDQSLTFRSLWYNYVNTSPGWDNWGDVFTDAKDHGVEIAYGRRLNKGTWLQVPAKFGAASYGTNGRRGMIGNLDLLLQNYVCSKQAKFNPSLHLGVGSTWDFRQEAFDWNIPAGAGLDIRLMTNLHLSLQTQYRFSIENRPGWHHGIGLVVYFGEPDRDGDGVFDKDDKCPDVKGLAKNMGCPDRDGDGVVDIADNCPDVAGLATLMGCPDRDNDGIADGDDKCPDIAGPAATMGCPDRDGDGILDADDECPDVAGIAAMKGCPDTDNDGITDMKDKCPREAGPAATMGCPDRDGDGVADKDDACPSKRGDSAHKGCPDSDGDGIYDDTDRCPEVAGVASLQGCPEPKKEMAPERIIKLVQFETGNAVILKKSYPVLDEVVAALNAKPMASVTINGHTDNAGDDKMNQQLSERRAKACYNYLAKKGIAKTRMSSAGYGESKPVGDNNTEAGREQNRRVEFELIVK